MGTTTLTFRKRRPVLLGSDDVTENSHFTAISLRYEMAGSVSS
jgi:hypothetical protein